MTITYTSHDLETPSKTPLYIVIQYTNIDDPSLRKKIRGWCESALAHNTDH